MCLWKILLVLTKSNMNRRTTINPRTNATANTPKSATDKCDGSIFEQKNSSTSTTYSKWRFVDGRVACSSPPVTQRLQVWAEGEWGARAGRGRCCHPHLIYTSKNNIAWRSPLIYSLPHPEHNSTVLASIVKDGLSVQSCNQESGVTVNNILLIRQWFPV